jgi:thiamine biosynthesis lipoprotein
MDRRDFLHPRHLAHGTGHVLGALDEINSLPDVVLPDEADPDLALLRMERRAMATSFEVALPLGTPRALEMGEAAFQLIDALEDQLTVYRDTSEVSRLNRFAPQRPVPVEEGLFRLLQLAARITEETGGAYDISAGALIKAWGFFRGPKRLPSDREREQARARVGMRHVVLRPESRSVRYLRPGLEINLGSIGKGYALDRVAELLQKDWKTPAALLHGGHSSVYAKGNPHGDERGWPVGLRHPWDRERRLGLFRLRDRTLGTSAATFKHLEHEGRKLGHILDPRTGWPAEGMASVSVVAPTGAEADALSTAFFVGGVEVACRYCEQHPEVGAVLLPEGEAARPVVLGLAPPEFTLLDPLTPTPLSRRGGEG